MLPKYFNLEKEANMKAVQGVLAELKARAKKDTFHFHFCL